SEPAAKGANPPKPPADGQTPTDHYGDPLPDGAVLRLGTVRLRHKEWLAAVAFSPSGKLVATGAEGGIIRLWDPSTGKELRPIEGHAGRLASLAFSPDGTLLASAGSKSVYLWDPLTGKKLREFANATTTPIQGGVEFLGAVPLTFSRDGKAIASVNSAGGVRVWDVATGQPRIGPLPHEKSVAALGFSPDGKTLVTAIGNRTEDVVIRRWEITTGKELNKVTIPRKQDQGFRPFAVSPDGKALALEGWEFVRRGNRAFSEYRIHLWDVGTGK